jgi:four helix bundle protein
MARSVRFDCQRLEVFGHAVEAVAVLDELAEELPEGRGYIRDQLRRAANSIALNIAEGAGEFVPAEKARFYRMAKRSATECAGQVLVCERLGLSEAPRIEAALDLPAEKGRAERRAERRDAAAAARTAADGDEPSGSGTASGAPGEPGPSNDAGPSTTSGASSGGTADDVQAGELPVHHPKVTRDGAPQASAQRNFTDPDSRIMERGGGFTQAYNGHIAVDDEWHVIVGQGASNQAPDTEYFIPMLERVQATVGLLPEKATADAGFWSPENAWWAEEHAVDAYMSTQRHRHGAPPNDPAEPPGPTATPQQRMRHKVSTPEGRAIYRRRKCLPEPVFGQIKQAMGFRRFSMRGMEKARGEWGLVCMCHNVRRLHAVTGRTAR